MSSSRVLRAATVRGETFVVEPPPEVLPARPGAEGAGSPADPSAAPPRPPVDPEQLLALAKRQAARLLEASRAEAGQARAAARAEAEQVLASAQAEAEHVRARARAEAERGLAESRTQGQAEGYEAGYQQGFEKGQADVMAALGAELARLQALADQALVDRAEMCRRAEAELVELALAVAQAVVHREVKTDPTLVADVVRAAVDQMTTGDQVWVRVNPEDYEALRPHWEQLETPDPNGRSAKVTPDERVQRGGCLVEARAARVDGRIETQLAQITQAFSGTLEAGTRIQD